MRLIDADTLDIAKEVETVCKALGFGEKSAFEGFVTGWLTGAIAEAPTVDVADVVHGEWEYEHGAWCCSKCGENNPYGVDYETNRFAAYCPNCGADMRESEEKE